MGYDLVISHNNSKADAEILSEKINSQYDVKCQIFACDLSRQDQVLELISFMKNFDDWNLLINNASIFKKSNFTSNSEIDLMENFNIHFFSPLLLSRQFALHLQNKPLEGQIINMLDKNIVRYDTSYFHYLLSKKSLAEATKMLALQLAPQIRVNAIAPGFILESVNSTNPDQERQFLEPKIPLQRKGDIKNIESAFDFLIKNDFVTGQIIFVDGGASLNHAG